MSYVPQAYAVEMGQESDAYRRASRAASSAGNNNKASQNRKNSRFDDYNNQQQDAGSNAGDNDNDNDNDHDRGGGGGGGQAQENDDYEVGHIADAKHPEMVSSHSLRRIQSARDEWAVDSRAKDPKEGLKCLWILLVLLLVGTLAFLSCYNSYMVNIYAALGNDGTYVWSLGWSSASFHNDGGASQASVVTRTTKEIPLTFTQRYAKDAGTLLVFTGVMCLVCLSFILIVMCTRCNGAKALYIRCCGVAIPQRASMYVAFQLIRNFCWSSVIYYVFVSIYGLLEISFYTSYLCAASKHAPATLDIGSGGTCAPYTIPHYGYWTLCVMTGAVSCFAFAKVENLDVRFSKKSLKLFYPQNIRAAQSRNCTLDLKYLLSALGVSRMIICITTVMWVAFNHSGLLMVVINDKTISSSDNQVAIFQPFGTDNSMSDWKKLDQFASFDAVASALGAYIPIMLLINLCFQVYLWIVIVKYKSIGCCKFSFILLSFVQWLVFTVLIFVYYFEFLSFFNPYGMKHPEEPLWYNAKDSNNDTDYSSYGVVWYPDWGLILVGLLEFYLIRLMYVSFKAM